MRTWGLDMSTSANDTGLVSIDWEERVATVTHRPRPTRSLILALLRETARTEWWAVDVPFGWPVGFGEWLTDHARGPACMAAGRIEIDAPVWAPLARRRTDRVVCKRLGKQLGFSVSFDKLGATAAAWAAIELSQGISPLLFDRAGMLNPDGVVAREGRVVETWPSAAWTLFTDLPTGVVLSPATASDEAFMGPLGPVLEIGPELREILAPGDDASRGARARAGHVRDAIVCAMVARSRAFGRTEGPEPEDASAAEREGWIHLPKTTGLTHLW